MTKLLDEPHSSSHQYSHTLLFRTCATAKSVKKAQKDGKAASKKTQVSNLKKRGQEIF